MSCSSWYTLRISMSSLVMKLAVVTIILATETLTVGGSEGRRSYYARSSKDLRDLAHRDFQTMVQLKQFKDQWPKGQPSSSLLAIADWYLQDFASSTVDGFKKMNETEHVQEAGWNPLAIFRIIIRVAHFFKHMRQQSNGFQDLPLNVLQKHGSAGGIPLKNDLADAARGILRIHFMYDLNVSDLALGKVGGVQTRTKLLATHSFYIGMVAKIRKQYRLAVEWLTEATLLAKVDGTVDISIVQAELMETIREHDKLYNAEDYSKLRFSDDDFYMTPLKSLHSVLEGKNNLKVKNVLQKEQAGKGKNCSYWSVNTWSLCSGETLHTPEASAHFFCWLEFKVNKAFTIGPLKMEFLSRYPDIVAFHDAFGDQVIKKTLAQADSANMSTHKFEDTVENRINIKSTAMTGLVATKFTAAEVTQVTSQLPGGHADVHVDAQPELDPHSKDDRIATLAIYLMDVHKGGYTVFPATFATAVPTKGSAIFWFNLLSDGSTDFSTAHVECPVVLGQKSVAYKWIRFYDQFSTRKCLLEPKARFQVLVNGKELAVPKAVRHELIDEHECKNAQFLYANATQEVLEENRSYTTVVGKYGYISSHSVQSLMRLEWEIYRNVRRVLGETEERDQIGRQGTEVVRRYLQDFNESAYNSITANTNSSVVEAVLKLAKNPLAVFRTYWRFENYIKKWMAAEEASKLPSPLRRIRENWVRVYETNEGPSKWDLEDAMAGLLNIQFVHDLKSDDMAQGIVAGTDAGIVLSAKQCIEFGIQAMAKGFYYQAIDWMQTAGKKVTSEADVTVDLEEAKIELETAKKVHDQLLTKSNGTEPAFYVSPVSASKNLTHLQTRKQAVYETYRFNKSREYAETNYRGICQGKPHQTTAEKSKLFCWHETEIHPFYKIGALKLEFLSMYPKAEVVLYHDVLGERLLSYLLNNTNRDYLVSATTSGADPDVRLSAVSWVHLNRSPTTVRILKMVNSLTGLNAVNPLATAIQLASYPPGGHYTAHADADDNLIGTKIARIATLMFYLTNVEKGGETAFSQAGVLNSPKKGSAIFWYNMLSSGDKHNDTFHGACPVIFGDKLVATQWFHYVDQHHLQCHSSRGSTSQMKVMVNGKSKFESIASI